MSDRYGNPDPLGDILRDLYGSDTVSGWFNQAQYFATGLPIIGDILHSADNYRYISDYLDNRGMSWSDVKYPSRIPGQSYGSVLSFVSSNIERLYE